MRHATLRAGLVALALLTLPACGGDETPGSDAAVTSGDPSGCPGEVVDVVVSVGAWSDVIRRLGGDCATVTTIAPGGDVPAGLAPADRSSFASADLVVVNGARYDEWAVDAASSAADDAVVVNAAEAADEQGRDPHLWYDPAVVPQVAAAVADELGRLSPDAAPYFDAQHTAWTAELQRWLEAVDDLRDAVGGRTFAAADGFSGRMAGSVGLSDVTPPGFAQEARAGTPSPDEVAALAGLLRSGAADVLVLEGDTEAGVTDRLREAADDADVPVVEVTEVPPEDAAFVDWQLGQLASLAEALTGE